MQCSRCKSMLPPGAPTCPMCANPTPYNVGTSSPNMYAPPPPPTSYGQPPYLPPHQIPYGQPMIVPVMVPPPKRSGCSAVWVVVIILLLILVCGGSLLGGGFFITQHNATATVTSMSINATSAANNATYTTALTPTPNPPYSESHSPSGATFSGNAQQVIANAQLASEVNSDHQATELQSTFQSGQTIYLVYQWTQGYTGYVQTRWYFNGEIKHTSTGDYIDQYTHGYGYATEGFYAYGNVGQGAVEVFWCQDQDCTRGGLAWVRPFSVSAQ